MTKSFFVALALVSSSMVASAQSTPNTGFYCMAAGQKPGATDFTVISGIGPTADEAAETALHLCAEVEMLQGCHLEACFDRSKPADQQ